MYKAHPRRAQAREAVAEAVAALEPSETTTAAICLFGNPARINARALRSLRANVLDVVNTDVFATPGPFDAELRALMQEHLRARVVSAGNGAASGRTI